jgi:hypothetical protein
MAHLGDPGVKLTWGRVKAWAAGNDVTGGMPVTDKAGRAVSDLTACPAGGGLPAALIMHRLSTQLTWDQIQARAASYGATDDMLVVSDTGGALNDLDAWGGESPGDPGVFLMFFRRPRASGR